jgi:hypothetical protein
MTIFIGSFYKSFLQLDIESCEVIYYICLVIYFHSFNNTTSAFGVGFVSVCYSCVVKFNLYLKNTVEMLTASCTD